MTVMAQGFVGCPASIKQSDRGQRLLLCCCAAADKAVSTLGMEERSFWRCCCPGVKCLKRQRGVAGREGLPQVGQGVDSNQVLFWRQQPGCVRRDCWPPAYGGEGWDGMGLAFMDWVAGGWGWRWHGGLGCCGKLLVF